MTTDTLRVGVIGAGTNTRTKHIPGLQAIDGIEVVAVCNRSQESGQRVADELGIPQVVTDWREIVADPTIDAVVIGTWPYMHKMLTIASLEAGKHVMCEARMAMDAREARAMREAARKRPELAAQIVPSPFTLRVDRAIQRSIAAGEIGEVLAVEVREGGRFLDRNAPLQWRQDAALSGCNVMSMGIWYEALMRWVGEATHVSAAGKVFARTRADEGGVRRAVRVPEHLDAVADLACGAQLHMQISAVTGLAGPAEAFIFGSEGTLRFCNNKLYAGRRGENELREVAIAPELEGRWRVEEEFVNAIRGVETITHTTFDDGVKYMEFSEAVARSIQGEGRIALPLT